MDTVTLAGERQAIAAMVREPVERKRASPMTLPDIAVIGGGLLGRCLAWRARRAGAEVALYEAGERHGEAAAAWAAAGMIAPTVESVEAGSVIASMGRRSIALWPQWLNQLPIPVFYRSTGTLLLWHRDGAAEAKRFETVLAAREEPGYLRRVHGPELEELEPALGSRFHDALYLQNEAQVDNREFLRAVGIALEDANVECHWRTPVADHAMPNAGIVVDCRGMGAKKSLPKLRGVRGEIIRLHAPEIELDHMLRLLHPRHQVYVVPRSEGVLVVGATSIESDQRSPVSVRGALELLSAGHSILPGLAEARILEFATQVRPALPNNLPGFRYDRERNVLHINGLYRHGFLLSPVVVAEALGLLCDPAKMECTISDDCLAERCFHLQSER
jgi:glycine oxidase